MAIPLLRRLPLIPLALALVGCAPCPVPSQPAPAAPAVPAPFEPSRVEPGDTAIVDEPVDTARIVEVRMVTTRQGASGEFLPREVHARQGDVLRFRMADGDAQHNVSFAGFASETRVMGTPADSPYLFEQGQSWQVRIDLPPGRYEFTCHPHHQTGHRGVLVVEER